jgi:hypothetical protein
MARRQPSRLEWEAILDGGGGRPSVSGVAGAERLLAAQFLAQLHKARIDKFTLRRLDVKPFQRQQKLKLIFVAFLL